MMPGVIFIDCAHGLSEVSVNDSVYKSLLALITLGG